MLRQVQVVLPDRVEARVHPRLVHDHPDGFDVPVHAHPAQVLAGDRVRAESQAERVAAEVVPPAAADRVRDGLHRAHDVVAVEAVGLLLIVHDRLGPPVLLVAEHIAQRVVHGAYRRLAVPGDRRRRDLAEQKVIAQHVDDVLAVDRPAFAVVGVLHALDPPDDAGARVRLIPQPVAHDDLRSLRADRDRRCRLLLVQLQRHPQRPELIPDRQAVLLQQLDHKYLPLVVTVTCTAREALNVSTFCPGFTNSSSAPLIFCSTDVLPTLARM